MSTAELGLDDRIVRRAERKLRQYGTDVNSYLTAVLVTIAASPSLPAVAFPPVPRPTENARKCIKAAKDIESGKVKAKGYTDMDVMMRDLLK